MENERFSQKPNQNNVPGCRIAYVLSAKGEDTKMSPWFSMESFTRRKKPRRKWIRIPQWNLQSLTLLM